MKRKIALCLSFIVFVFSAYLSSFHALESLSVSNNENKLCVVIDAGHGGLDGGVTGRNLKLQESDINLSIAFALKELFLDIGFEVVMTRKTEFGLVEDGAKWNKNTDMKKRKEMIVNANPSLVISVHQNSYPNDFSVRGGQVFYGKENAQSKKIALAVQRSLNEFYLAYKVKARVAKLARYYILECASVPSILVECGFLSNAEDEKLLSSQNNRERLARSIFQGVISFYFTEL